MFDIPGSNELGSSQQLYKWEECWATFRSKPALTYHTNSKHEGLCYSCEYCGFKATSQGNLKQHREAIHEGVKRYSCNQCDYRATRQSHIKVHKKSVHEGVRYSCNQCDHQATQQSNLMTHKKSVHECVRYSCGHIL